MSRSLPLKSVNEPTTKWDFFSNAGAICGCVSSRHKWLISVPTEMKPGSAGLHPWLLYQASTMQTFAFSEFFFFLLKHTPLERCCVHKMSPFISSNGLSPGSRDAKVQRAKVCLTCTEPTVARSSYWSLPVGQYLSDSRCKGSRWSLWDELRAIWPKSRRHLLVIKWESGEQPVVPLTSTFDTWWVYGILMILHSAHMSNASRRESRYFYSCWNSKNTLLVLTASHMHYYILLNTTAAMHMSPTIKSR